MRIGISMRVTSDSQFHEKRDGISHDWLRFLRSIELEPVLIPNFVNEKESYDIKALILSNGNDIGLFDNDGKDSSDLSCERDETELWLIRHAIKNKIPVLGVCRGMQFINGYFGGGLKKINDLMSHVSNNHAVDIIDSKFVSILGNQPTVNSFHKFGIFEDSISKNLRIFALHSQHQICEGLYHPELPVMGIQWHPERKCPNDEKNRLLIDNFLRGKFFWKGSK